MQSIAFLVAFVVALAACADDCKPEKDEAQGWQCCKAGKGVVPDSFVESVKKCVAMNPLPPKPSGPPSAAGMKEVHQAIECSAECVFAENGLLTADKKIDKAAVGEAFRGVAKGDKDMEMAMNTALDKCFTSYMSDMDISDKCKSGAMQFEKCIMRETFLNCPRSGWTSSDDCNKLKTKVTKCPKMPVMMISMPPPSAS